MDDRELPGAEDGLAPDRPVAGGLAYREWGSPEAPAVVFWHGLQPAGPWRLDGEAGPGWADAGFRVLGISAPGWETAPLGRSDYRPTALARAIVDFLGELGLERVFFAGFSWGASIGCHLAVAAPQRLRGLILLDAGYTDFQDDPDFEQPTYDQAVENVRGLRFESWEAVFAAMSARTRKWRPSLEAATRAAFEEIDGWLVPRVSPEVMGAAALGVMEEQPSATLPALGRLDLPVLLLAASGTLETQWGRGALDRFRRDVPHATVIELDSGHDLLADAADETVRVVTAWATR